MAVKRRDEGDGTGHPSSQGKSKDKIKLKDKTKVAKRSAKRERQEAERLDPSLKEKRLRENVPRTIENSRTPVDDVALVNIDREALVARSSSATAKILITTSKKPVRETIDFAMEMVNVLPNSHFVKRGLTFEIKEMAGLGAKRGYTHLLVINEDHKEPNALMVVLLPNGPSTYFKLSSYQTSRSIYHHARSTPHAPELVLNNFTTNLGQTVGLILQSLVPGLPEFQGRQVVTLHNQRDFIFFRRHRYIFKSEKKVGLQEIGPRFTLKCQWVQSGVYARDGLYEWQRLKESEADRKKFYL